MVKLMGKEAEMQEESALELPGVNATRDEWENFRDRSDAFAGEREHWGFCASEVIYPDSLFFLGLNPSEPKGHRHEHFELMKLVGYGKIFSPLRLIADKLKMKYSYFDLFSVRRSKAGDLTRKLPKLLGTGEGRQAVATLIGLTRQAVQTAQPKAIYVCNATARDILRGEGPNAKGLREAGIIPALFPDCPAVRPHPCDAGGKTWRFFYTVAPVDGQRIPVLLGIDVWSIKETPDTKDRILESIVTTLKDALAGPDKYYRTLPEES